MAPPIEALVNAWRRILTACAARCKRATDVATKRHARAAACVRIADSSRIRQENRRPWTLPRSIVIVGGGFAGTTLARALDGKLPRGYELVLISEESYTTFNPMLPEAVGASVFPEQVVAPIRQMLVARRGS